MGQIIKDQKETNRKISYEDISTSLENDEGFAYYIENDNLDSEKVIYHFLIQLDRFIKKIFNPFFVIYKANVLIGVIFFRITKDNIFRT
jgi:hypothetical protein